ELDMREAFAEQLEELQLAQLTHVERVRLAGSLCVDIAVGRGQEEHTVRGQDALDDIEHAVVVLHMLDGLQAGDHVEGAARERFPIYHGALDEREIATAIRSPAVLDREGVDVHSHHLGRSLRQDGRAKALTACQVHHPLSCYELRTEVIAMQM